MAILLTFIFWVLVFAVLGSHLLNGYMILLVLRYPKPQTGNEVHTIKTDDDWNIELFRRKTSEVPGEPVLLVHALTANHLNFETPAGLSLVDVLAAEGYDCWSLDLRCCESAGAPEGRGIGDISFDDYLFKDLPAAIAYIREATGHGKVHWVGHSMGGMLLYAYNVAFGSEYLASGISLGAPAGFKNVFYKPPSLLFRLTAIAPNLTRTILKSFTPFARSLRPAFIGFPVNWDNVHPGVDARALFNMVEAVPPLVAAEIDGWLSTGDWKVNRGQLDVSANVSKIDVPLLVVCGKQDPLTPEPKIRQFFDALPGRDKKLVFLSKKNGFVADYGHADLAFGVESTKEVYGPALEWIQEHYVKGIRRSRKSVTAAAPTGAATARKAEKKAPARKAAATKKTVSRQAPSKTEADAQRKSVAKKTVAPKKKARSRKKSAT
ncbi:MAG TPA: alpha/beta hydrolase [Candidatus Hydrogenedentes bacterium]|nr:alpha/beta hydrolase [Candidatus Hydrogenedentota bacterium]